ncbi:MAG: hypothetical protein EOP04_18995 [Proteobacteria bacterium]|nr:MAG: hypothetical protein EOP04_18995 [Pseudomonadota bacterium]
MKLLNSMIAVATVLATLSAHAMNAEKASVRDFDGAKSVVWGNNGIISQGSLVFKTVKFPATGMSAYATVNVQDGGQVRTDLALFEGFPMNTPYLRVTNSSEVTINLDRTDSGPIKKAAVYLQTLTEKDGVSTTRAQMTAVLASGKTMVVQNTSSVQKGDAKASAPVYGVIAPEGDSIVKLIIKAEGITQDGAIQNNMFGVSQLYID